MMTFHSRASEEFWDLYKRIPRNAQRAADKQFELFRKDPTHPSLHLKPVGGLWSARINDAYRALAVREDDVFYWFWVGPHDQYERLINR
jgi:hypothetical protein